MVINLKRVLWIAAVVAMLWACFAFLARRAARPAPVSRASTESITVPPVPPLDGSLWAEGRFADGPKYRINFSTATFQFDMEPWNEKDAKLGTRLWPSYAAAYEAGESRAEPRLTSLDVVTGIAKMQEDEILASLELSLLRQTESFLDRLTRQLKVRNSTPAEEKAHADALAWATAAQALCQPRPKPENKRAREILANFRSGKAWAEPLSFYADSEELERAWAVQRFLRASLAELFSEDPRSGAVSWQAWAALYQAIAEDADLTRAFTRLSRWSAMLDESAAGFSGETLLAAFRSELLPGNAWLNPGRIEGFFKPFRQHFPSGMSILPPAIPVENLFISIARQRGAGTMDRVLKGLAENSRYSAIGEDSGWYARQRFALMPLLRPEDALESYKLALTGAYRERLRKAFSASLTKVRETHVARHNPLFPSLATKKKLQIYALKPALEIEPQATVFLRQAETAKWLRQRIATEADAGPESASAGKEVSERLKELENRSLGLFCVAARNLGMTNALSARGWSNGDLRSIEESAREWLRRWPESRLAGRDTRVAVPVARAGNSVTYWATIGVQLHRLKVGFLSPPALEVQAENGQFSRAEWNSREACRVAGVTVQLLPEMFLIPADAFVEFTRSGETLTREEFRDLLPRNSTVENTRAKLR
jgi:hypothetical protein